MFGKTFKFPIVYAMHVCDVCIELFSCDMLHICRSGCGRGRCVVNVVGGASSTAIAIVVATVVSNADSASSSLPKKRKKYTFPTGEKPQTLAYNTQYTIYLVCFKLYVSSFVLQSYIQRRTKYIRYT